MEKDHQPLTVRQAAQLLALSELAQYRLNSPEES